MNTQTYLIIAIFAAFLLGGFIGYYIHNGKRYDGAFRINMSDPEKDIFTMEWWRDLEGIQDLEEVKFKIIVDESRKIQGL